VYPAPLGAGGGEHLAQRTPEPQGAVADGEDRGPHPSSLEVAQQVGPRLGGLPVAVGDRDQLLGAIRPDTHDDQATQPVLFETDVEVHAVSPHVHEVPVAQVTFGERALLGLPLCGEPGDHRRGEPSGRPEEPRQRRREVTAGHAVQVHERQHLRDLRRLASPGRQDRRAEPASLTGLIDALVVDPRRLHFDAARGRGDRAGLGVAVADHQAPASLVQLTRQTGDVVVGLDLERGSQHPPGALQNDLIQRRPHLHAGVVIGHYSQHRRSFLAGAPTPAELVPFQRGRYVAPSNGSPIHRFKS
jgi:hypothetical protein